MGQDVVIRCHALGKTYAEGKLRTPVFDGLRFIAPVAWVPFAALWFGTGIGGPVLIIFMGAFPPEAAAPHAKHLAGLLKSDKVDAALLVPV